MEKVYQEFYHFKHLLKLICIFKGSLDGQLYPNKIYQIFCKDSKA